MSSRWVAPLFFEEDFGEKGATNLRVCTVSYLDEKGTFAHVKRNIPEFLVS